jgi:Homeodomain-like domain
LERQPDHRRSGNQPIHGLPGAQTTVEEGFEAVLSRKPRAMPAVARIFDGKKEAKLIALACSKPPKGRARWTLRLLENRVVELGIVDRARDSTIGRALKKHSSAPSPPALRHPAEGQQRVRSPVMEADASRYHGKVPGETSTAKPSPLTRPASMHARTTASNT